MRKYTVFFSALLVVLSGLAVPHAASASVPQAVAHTVTLGTVAPGSAATFAVPMSANECTAVKAALQARQPSLAASAVLGSPVCTGRLHLSVSAPVRVASATAPIGATALPGSTTYSIITTSQYCSYGCWIFEADMTSNALFNMYNWVSPGPYVVPNPQCRFYGIGFTHTLYYCGSFRPTNLLYFQDTWSETGSVGPIPWPVTASHQLQIHVDYWGYTTFGYNY